MILNRFTSDHGRGPYRSDLDGLRAFAVILVVLFHLDVDLFSGGYVGVDVFFVISGYLVTGAIIREIRLGHFSIIDFYGRRARRILPALFATMLMVVVAGLLILMPDELRETGASLVGIAIFASNVLFWQQIDYFNKAIELQPLVHTWSLSVEEQFYILLPILLLFIERIAPGRQRFPLVCLAAASLSLSVAMVWLAPEANYYLLPTRAWELLTGSAVALGYIPPIHSRRWAAILSSTGIAMIVGSAMLLTSNSAFPGYNALWPCLGTAAFIHVNSYHSTLTGRLVSSRLFVALGLISYSLYLVHWPIIVFVGYVLLRPLTGFETVLLFVAMIATAALSWWFVEQPFRNRRKVTNQAIFSLSIIGLTGFTAIGIVFFTTDGLPQRFPDLKLARSSEKGLSGPRCFLKDGKAVWAGSDCFITRAARKPVTLLWGDSHADHYRRGLSSSNPPLRANILLYSSAGCLPILDNTGTPRPHCAINNARVMAIIERYNVQRVILSGQWEYAGRHTGMPLSDVQDTIQKIKSAGVRVSVIGDNPDFTFSNPHFLVHRLRRRVKPDEPFFVAARNHPSVNQQLRALVQSHDFFDPFKELCHKDGCLVYENGQTIMRDNGHLSSYGADKVTQSMRKFLEN